MARLKLLCLPYSGASAMVYSRWRRHLPQWLEVQPLELPGRGTRFAEPLHTDMQVLAKQLAAEVSAKVKVPYALFGHSLGAILGYELIHALQAQGAALPLAFVASGTAAPSRRENYAAYAQPKSDAELLAELKDLNGTPDEVLQNEELMALTLPVLRADFLLCGRYQYQPRNRLPMPVYVLGGKEDRSSVDQLLAWQDEADHSFSLDMLPGGHFFIHQYESRVLGLIKAKLEILWGRYIRKTAHEEAALHGLLSRA